MPEIHLSMPHDAAKEEFGSLDRKESATNARYDFGDLFFSIKLVLS